MIKFFRDKNMAVITSRFVLTGASTILFVVHNSADGIWEFYGKEELDNNDLKVVSIDEILQIDCSILELRHMSQGRYAYREFKGDSWTILDM